jgi:hypothetical protein
MPERVNIQYSINLDEIGTEVQRIYKKAQNIISNISLPDVDEESVLSSDTIKEVENIRLSLVSLDATLKDVDNIVASYLRYKIMPEETFEEEDVDNDTLEVSE